jgi:sugar lactone lactonase YvrE
MKKLLWLLLLIVVTLGLYLLIAPTPLNPLAYEPPAKPAMIGPLAPNDLLAKAQLIGLGKLDGPEDLALAPDGTIYCGNADGSIRKVSPTGQVTTWLNTGGRPLGMAFDRAGNLIVCDAVKGLLSISPAGKIEMLADRADGLKFGFTDDLDIATDGKIYFSDASSRWGMDEYLYDLLEHRARGRLLVYDPASKQVSTLLDGLYFANGVALSRDQNFVLVNETYAYRIRRFWLKGPKAGQAEIFIDNLPGFPDNVSANRQGRFWLALFTVRNDAMDRLHPYPLLKKIMAKLPRFTWPKPRPHGLVLALDEAGNITMSLQDPSGKHLNSITSAKQWQGALYMGSLHNDRIGKYQLAKK